MTEDIRQWLIGLEAPPLSIHTGIASGQVVASRMGSEGHREHTVTGDSVNLATRLTDLAGPGKTYASAGVARGLGSRLAAAFLGPRSIEGLPEPVEVWRIDGMVAVDQLAPATTFVGRGSSARPMSLSVPRTAWPASSNSAMTYRAM